MNVFISYSSSFDGELARILVERLSETGVTPRVWWQHQRGSSIMPEITSAIRSADLLVALIAAPNANVFYEVGLAAGANIPVLVAAQSGESVPSNLSGVPYVQLTGDVSNDAQTIVRRVSEMEIRHVTKAIASKSAEEVLREAAHDPAILEALSSHEFERLVASLFEDRGCFVQTTSPSRDNGVDLIVTAPDSNRKILVELKKYNKQSRVSVSAVSELAHFVAAAGASSGLLLSTSGFTAAAIALAVGFPIALRKLEDILDAQSVNEILSLEPPEKTSGNQRP